MFNFNINFNKICDIIAKWKWRELRFGLEKSIISNRDIISYAIQILDEDIEQFDLVLKLSIAEEDEVEKILPELVLDEGEQDLETISSKWIFAIIYEAYTNCKDKVYDVIDDVYTEFEYPEEISILIGYMPCEDNRSMDVKLDEYIETNRHIWC